MNARLTAILASTVLLAGCASGPRLGEWKWSGGPSGQNISAIHIDSENPQKWTAALVTGEIFRSLNGATSWHRLSPFGHRVYRFIQLSGDSTNLLAATAKGLFRFEDSLATWQPVGLAGQVFTFTSDPFKKSTQYSGVTGRGLLRSIDDGISWNAINSGIPDSVVSNVEVRAIQILQRKPDYLFAALRGYGVVSSSDGGTSWRLLTTGIPQSQNVSSLVLFQSQNVLVAGTSDGTIIRSSDFGASWRATRSGFLGGSILSLMLDPTSDKRILAGTELGADVSEDAGSTWRPFSSDIATIPTNVGVFGTKENRTVVLFGEGIGLKSYVADAWRNHDAGIGGSAVTTVASDRSGKQVLCSVGGSIHRYSHDQSGWISISNGLAGGTVNALSFIADSSSHLFAGTSDGIYRSTDSGKRWIPLSRAHRAIPVRMIETHPSIRTRLYVSGETGLWISTNGGGSWDQAKPILTPHKVHALTFSPTNAAVLYGATSNESFIKTTDGGFHWERSRYGTPPDAIRLVSLHPDDKNSCFAWTTSGEGFRSSDNGTTWAEMKTPWVPGSPVLLALDKWRPSSMVALVNRSQLYYSSNGGSTWLVMETIPIQDELLTMHYNAASATVYLGTSNNGVYSLSLADDLLNAVAAQ